MPDSSPAPLPLVSIGIPVRDGENYIQATLDAVSAQDYENLEILVSDNASDDSTCDIVTAHAQSDPRVRLFKQPQNIGAAPNYNDVFDRAEGKYFAWNAHDDFATPDFVSSAVRALEADPSAVLAIGHPYWVDEGGEKISSIPVSPDVWSESPADRFRAAARGESVELVFGVFRREAVARTSMHGEFTGSDRNFVAEIMLYGKAVFAGESEFNVREHANRSTRRFVSPDGRRFDHAREAWFSAKRGGKLVFPSWRRFGAYFTAVARAPLSMSERLSCFAAATRLVFDDGGLLIKMMVNDLGAAVVHIGRSLGRSRPD